MNKIIRKIFLFTIGLASVALTLPGFLAHQAGASSSLAAAARARSSREYSEAVEYMREVVSLVPWRADLWEQLGMDELNAGSVKEAEAALLEAERRGELTLPGEIALGDAQAAQENLVAAVQTWQKASRRENVSSDVFKRLCQGLRDLDDRQAALSCAQQWKAAFPGEAAAIYLEGILLMVDRPEEAIPVLLSAAEKGPGYTTRVESLRKAYGQAMVTDEPARQKILLGRALGSAGDWDLAEALFEQAVSDAPTYAEAWAFLGEARQRLGEDGQAELDKALELDPESLSARAFAAVRLRRTGAYEQALALLDEIIAQEPGEGIWRAEAGAISADKGDMVKALEYYQSAVEVDADSLASWQALANFSINYEIDVAGVGLPAARTCMEMAPSDPVSLELMGWALMKMGDLASAERFLQRALQEDNRFATAHLHLGQAFLQQERDEAAKGHLRMALDLDRDGPVGRLARRLLERYYPGEISAP